MRRRGAGHTQLASISSWKFNFVLQCDRGVQCPRVVTTLARSHLSIANKSLCTTISARIIVPGIPHFSCKHSIIPPELRLLGYGCALGAAAARGDSCITRSGSVASARTLARCAGAAADTGGGACRDEAVAR